MNTLWCIHRVGSLIKVNISAFGDKEKRKRFGIRFGKHIKKIRLEKGLTQEELSHKANIHTTYLGHIKTGTYVPSIYIVWCLAKALGVNIENLFSDF